ncbi:hypothetical protein D3C85_1570190 [compost metagenome]
MAARRVQRHAQRGFILTHQGEMSLGAPLRVIFYAHVCIVTETVSRNMTTHTWQ